MLPVNSLRLALGDLLAADVPTLAPVAANKIALIAAPFVMDQNTVLAGLTLATFTGSAPKAGAAGAQQVGVDPATGDQVITILQPAGGYRFECTVAPATPETIYGAALINNAGTALLGLMELPNPINIAAVTDFVDVGTVEMRFVQQPIS
jgi:hypothetical protein